MCFGVIFFQMKALKPKFSKGKYVLKRRNVEKKKAGKEPESCLNKSTGIKPEYNIASRDRF
jgi:hypothetical protein